MPSQHATDAASERLTNSLLADVRDIMQRAEADGHDPDEELRAAVGHAFVQGMEIGREWDVQAGGSAANDSEGGRDDDARGKRPRMDEGER